MPKRHTLLAATAVAAAMLGTAPAASAAPSSDNDLGYLAAVEHGSLCCPDQPNDPIGIGTPERQIQVGRSNAEYMTTFPTLRAFNDVAKLNQQQLGLNPQDAGDLVAIAIRFYADPSVEGQVRAQMGAGAQQWYGNAG